MSPGCEPSARGSWTVAAVSYALGWCALCTPWLSGGLTIPYDAKAHFQAQLQFLANALHAGQSPFWTPHVFSGSPQIADPQSLIFSPAILVAYFNPAPSFTTVDAFVLGLLGCGGLAILLFFRDRGWHAAGGLVAALAFAFGASAAWRVQHIGQVQSFALFGVSLWLLGRVLDRPGIGRGILAGLAAGLMVVEPDQVALLACYVLAGFVVADVGAAREPRARLIALLPALTAASITGAILIAGPLIMVYLFVQDSSRADIPFATAVRGSLHPASLLTAVVGDLYGALDQKVDYWGPYSETWDRANQTLSQNMSQIYTGALPALLLLTIGLVRGHAWHRDIRYFTIALASVTIYALGAFTPVFGLIFEVVPGVHLFRRPADATFLMGGLMAIVGGYLVHRLAQGTIPAASRATAKIEAFLVIALFATGAGIASAHGHLADSMKPLAIAAVCMAGAAGAAVLVVRLAPWQAWASILAAGAFATADLAINNGPNESTALPMARYDILKLDTGNETIRFLKTRLAPVPNSPRRDRVELVGLGFEWPNASMVHGFENILGYNPLRLRSASEGIGAGEIAAGWDQRHFSPLFPSYRSRLADLLGMRFIASGVPIEWIDKRLQPGDLKFLARTADAFLYENPRALPRVMLATNWRIADFDALIKTGQWPQFDPEQTVLLDHAPPIHTRLAEPATFQAAGTVAISHYENTVVGVDVVATKASFVVLNSMWHPWWRATVDGKPADILKANVIFGAVRVPAGRHRVEFVFEPVEGAFDQLTGASPVHADGASRRDNQSKASY
jgi:hypothetical protein